MKLEKCKPIEIPIDPAKFSAERRAKRQAFAEILFRLLVGAAVLYFLTHPADLMATITYLQKLFSSPW